MFLTAPRKHLVCLFLVFFTGCVALDWSCSNYVKLQNLKNHWLLREGLAVRPVQSSLIPCVLAVQNKERGIQSINEAKFWDILPFFSEKFAMCNIDRNEVYTHSCSRSLQTVLDVQTALEIHDNITLLRGVTYLCQTEANRVSWTQSGGGKKETIDHAWATIPFFYFYSCFVILSSPNTPRRKNSPENRDGDWVASPIPPRHAEYASTAWLSAGHALVVCCSLLAVIAGF